MLGAYWARHASAKVKPSMATPFPFATASTRAATEVRQSTTVPKTSKTSAFTDERRSPPPRCAPKTGSGTLSPASADVHSLDPAIGDGVRPSQRRGAPRLLDVGRSPAAGVGRRLGLLARHERRDLRQQHLVRLTHCSQLTPKVREALLQADLPCHHRRGRRARPPDRAAAFFSTRNFHAARSASNASVDGRCHLRCARCQVVSDRRLAIRPVR